MSLRIDWTPQAQRDLIVWHDLQAGPGVKRVSADAPERRQRRRAGRNPSRSSPDSGLSCTSERARDRCSRIRGRGIPERDDPSPQKDEAPLQKRRGVSQKKTEPRLVWTRGLPKGDEGSPKKDEASSERDEGSPQKDRASSLLDGGSPKKTKDFPKKGRGGLQETDDVSVPPQGSPANLRGSRERPGRQVERRRWWRGWEAGSPRKQTGLYSSSSQISGWAASQR